MSETRGEHIFTPFDEDLEGFAATSQEMGRKVSQQLTLAAQSLVEGDFGLARQVVQRDNGINQLSMQAYEQGMNLLAVHQPLAGDLRLIICLHQAANHLEETGDEAKKIARITIRNFDRDVPFSRPELFSDVQVLCEIAAEMLGNSMRALENKDVDLAVAVIMRDERLNALFSGDMRRLSTYLMEDPANIGGVLDALLALKSMERVGDLSCSIAKNLIFAVKGKDVRFIKPSHLSEGYLDD